MAKRERNDLNVECRVETHCKMSLIVLVEYTEETLLEDGGSEGIG